jgi:hypothetical protein
LLDGLSAHLDEEKELLATVDEFADFYVDADEADIEADTELANTLERLYDVRSRIERAWKALAELSRPGM